MSEDSEGERMLKERLRKLLNRDPDKAYMWRRIVVSSNLIGGVMADSVDEDLKIDVNAAIESLPLASQRCVAKMMMAGYTWDEISDNLGVTRYWIGKTKELLKERLRAWND